MGEFLDKSGLERVVSRIGEKLSNVGDMLNISTEEHVVGKFNDANIYEKTYVMYDEDGQNYNRSYMLDSSINATTAMLISYYGQVKGICIYGGLSKAISNNNVHANPAVSLYPNGLYYVNSFNPSISSSGNNVPGSSGANISDAARYFYVTVRYIKTAEIDLSAIAISKM